MAISFSEIPQNLRAPIFAAEFDASQNVPQSGGYRALVCGIGATGTGDIIRVFNGQQFELFGDCQIKDMFDIFFQNNRLQEVFAYAFPAPTGVAETITITATGSATANETSQIYLNGKRISFSILSGDSSDDVATKISNAISSQVFRPVDVAAAGSVVTLTAKQSGTWGGQIDVRDSYADSDRSIPGVTVDIAVGSAGTGDIDYSSLVADLDSRQYNVVIVPDSTRTLLSPLITELEERYGALSEKEGFLFAAEDDTLSNITTLGATYNENIVSLMGFFNSPMPAYLWAAGYGAVSSVSLADDPALPLQNLEIKGILPPPPSDQFDYSERNALLFSGISTFFATVSGRTFIDSAITTYRTNAQGVTSDAFLNVENVATLFFLRRDWNNYLRTKYPRAKAGNDGGILPAGQTIVTPSVLRSELISRATFWAEIRGLIEDIDGFTESLLIERNSANPDRFDIVVSPNLINQFKIAATRIAFLR